MQRDVLSTFAIHRASGVYASAASAVREDVFDCPSCHQSVIVVRGAVNRPHFRHRREAACTWYTPHPSESDLHKHAKFLLAQRLRDGATLVMYRTCPRCATTTNLPTWTKPANAHIAIEHRLASGDGVVDVACIEALPVDAPTSDAPPPTRTDIRFWFRRKATTLETPRAQTFRVTCFEIRASHKTESRPEPWFEFDAATIADQLLAPATSYLVPCVRSLSPCITCTQLESAVSELQLNDRADDALLLSGLWQISISGSADVPMSWTCTFDLRKQAAWRAFVSLQKCACCRTTYTTTIARPYCHKCYVHIRRQDERQIDFSAFKFPLRDLFRRCFADAVVGGIQFDDESCRICRAAVGIHRWCNHLRASASSSTRNYVLVCDGCLRARLAPSDLFVTLQTAIQRAFEYYA